MGGSAGDAKVRLTQIAPENASTPPYSPLQSTSVMEYINLGKLSIASPRIFSGEGGPTGITLQLDLNVPSNTCDLIIYDLVLIPIDEWACVANNIALSSAATLVEIDGGLIRQDIVNKDSATGVSSRGQLRGRSPRLPPDKSLQLHFLFGIFGSSINQSVNYFAASIKVFTHERWEMLRGSE